ncbi:hypothetical protein CU254_29485 [Amycolatopsis sp. AA4]|uniref:hypothetical protein n=1 Tax=Actinomycetes TaxID=1760 RepID=UPI0001DEE56B|nr:MULTISPECIES: hypothetical protein [Actinomycetes]ATY14091.1 hypothetical protein CU254_29485 [Amycolatopsis sp. AA4]EFL10132.1 hypothetical protein SSMG_05803 [Streptomyces sp. AA4]
MHVSPGAPATVPPPAPDSAVSTAVRAANRAGVRIRLADDLRTLDAVSRFLARVWLTPESQPPFGTDALCAVVHAGGAVHYASDDDGILAASALIFCAPATRAVYSLIAAARASDRGVGFALKQAQRVWALDQGAETMIWTFDPLVSRNAHFNLAKLGARGTEYTVDFYGQIEDGVNGTDETDRCTAVLSLREPNPAQLPDPDLTTAEIDPRLAPDGEPLLARDSSGYWCRVPSDIVAIRRSDARLGAQWRYATRDALVPLFADGYLATGFSRSGWYRLTKGDRA